MLEGTERASKHRSTINGMDSYPLTRNYYENNSLRIIFRNFGGILSSSNSHERKTFQGITREIRNFSENIGYLDPLFSSATPSCAARDAKT